MSQETECNCVNRVSAGRNERGDKERCVDCGRVWLILNGEEVWLEELEQVEDEQERAVDQAILEKKEDK